MIELVDQFQLDLAYTAVTRSGGDRFLFEGHHTIVAAAMLGIDGWLSPERADTSNMQRHIHWRNPGFLSPGKGIKVAD